MPVKMGLFNAKLSTVLPSQEVWNIESINSTIRQIEYYKDTRVFTSRNDIIKLYGCLERTMDYIQRQAPSFCDYTWQHFQNIIKKSTLISEVGEKDRSRFFNLIKEKINARKNALL